MAYSSQSLIDSRRKLAEMLRGTPMREDNRRGAGTDIFRGLAHLLRADSARRFDKEAEDMIAANAELKQKEMGQIGEYLRSGHAPMEQGPLREGQHTFQHPDVAASLAQHEMAKALQKPTKPRMSEPFSRTYVDESGEQRTEEFMQMDDGSTVPMADYIRKTGGRGPAQPPAAPTPVQGVEGAISAFNQGPVPQPTTPQPHVPSGPNTDPYAQASRAGEIKKKEEARQRFTTVVEDMMNNFLGLEGMQANVSYARDGVSNVFNYLRAEVPVIDRALGTKVGAFRQALATNRPMLLNYMRQATEQGARGLDSNRELDFYLQAATNDSYDIHTNMAALYKLNSMLGGRDMEVSPGYEKILSDLEAQRRGEAISFQEKLEEIAVRRGMTLEQVREDFARRAYGP